MYGINGMDPKAQKRFNNDRSRAAQHALTGQAAKLSTPVPGPNTNNNTTSNSRVAQQQRSVNAGPSNGPPQQQSVPTGNGTALSRAGAQSVPEFSPEESAQNAMKLETFLSSPEVQESISRSKLRKFFAGRNSGTQVDVASDALANMLYET